ncbi:hypothetical protein MPNTM1_05389 [Mycolicibacterium parafortuitum]
MGCRMSRFRPPQRAADSFVAWAADASDRQMEADFYSRVDKTRLFADGYIAGRSRHDLPRRAATCAAMRTGASASGRPR